MSGWNSDDDYSHLNSGGFGKFDSYGSEDDDFGTWDDEPVKKKSKKEDDGVIKHKVSTASIAAKLENKALTTEQKNKIMAETQAANNAKNKEKLAAEAKEKQRIEEHNARMRANAVEIKHNTAIDQESSVEFRKRTGTGKISLNTESGTYGVHHNKTGAGKPGIKKDARPIRVTNLSATSMEIDEKLRKRIIEVGLKAILGRHLFEEKPTLKHDKYVKKLSKRGNVEFTEKVWRIAEKYQTSYHNYLSSLDKLLKNPNLGVKATNPHIKLSLDNAGKYHATVNPSWKPLSAETIERKKKGEGALDTWKHTGKLRQAFHTAMLQQKKRTSDLNSFLDASEVIQELQRINSSKLLDLNTRTQEVKFRFYLQVPTWQGPNSDLMDELITKPFSGARPSKISHFFIQEHEHKLNMENYLVKANHDAGDARYEANRVIQQEKAIKYWNKQELQEADRMSKGKYSQFRSYEEAEMYFDSRRAFHLDNRLSEKEVDKKYEPFKVKDARNIFFKSRRINSEKETGLRRFINPEFRRPFVGKLSVEAGKVARASLKDITQKLSEIQPSS